MQSKGDGSLTVSVDNSTVTLEAGDLCFIAPFVLHKNESTSHVLVDVLAFSPHIFLGSMRALFSQKPIVPYLRSQEVPPLIFHLFNTLPRQFEGFTSQPNRAENFCYHLSFEDSRNLTPYLSVLVLETANAMQMVKTGQKISSMHAILNYCAQNYTNDISREDIARDCQISPSLVSHTFARLDTTLRDYINALRIYKAYELLTTTQTPITQIIYECGYTNQGTFNRNFYDRIGMTPRDVRSGQI